MIGGLNLAILDDWGLESRQLDEVRAMHAAYGLRLAVQHSRESIAWGGSTANLVTELLRLAQVGAAAESMMRAGVDGRVSDLVNDTDVTWKAAFR
ncbi:hypothetical protein [Phenylobacterium sp.]|uniref:hypothetical protein n=1 Tax=Phenylobacterium sp. TaxID=1871053 RepID=UPI00301DF97B